MRIRTYTDEQLTQAVVSSLSFAQVIKKLGLKQSGGTHAYLRRVVKTLGLSTSHFTGQLWNKDRQLKDFPAYCKHQNFRYHLIKKRGKRCERCLNTEWLGSEMPFEVHHVDGNRKNNEEANLQVLCPNCHALTTRFRRRVGPYSLKKH